MRNYPNWNTKEGTKCLEELEVEYEETIKPKKELLGVVYVFLVFQENPEYQEALQALLCPFVDLPLLINSKYRVVNMIIKKRLKYHI